ncbi:hypothetical protein ABE44_03775 [Bacillus thuringiensis]|nr:hypothetical protein [Bacillus thuringiensis]
MEEGAFQHPCRALPNKETYPKRDRAPFLQGFQDISWDTLPCAQWAHVTPELRKKRLTFKECYGPWKGGIDSSLQCPQDIFLDFALCLRHKGTVGVMNPKSGHLFPMKLQA